VDADGSGKDLMDGGLQLTYLEGERGSKRTPRGEGTEEGNESEGEELTVGLKRKNTEEEGCRTDGKGS